MAYTTIDDPTIYFNTKLYTGNGTAIGSGGNAITGVGFQPDWVWIKSRTQAEEHEAFDAVRGVTKYIRPSTNAAEATDSESLTTFGTDGFTLGNHGQVNANSQSFVSWNWKETATAGFDIVSYTGTGSAKTVSHNLSVKPDVIICKSRSGAEEWRLYFSVLGATKAMRLNGTNAEDTDSGYWNNTEPTSSVFTVGTNAGTNGNGVTFIAYCLTEKKGYSKFGSYTGNGNADGTFVYTGFKPAWLMIKQSSGAGNDWLMYDNKRDTSNVASTILTANASATEATGQSYNYIDLLSNGFKLRGSDARNNGSGGTMIYMAFAESPFVNSNGVPNNGR